jgi:hypothetical protein
MEIDDMVADNLEHEDDDDAKIEENLEQIKEEIIQEIG